MEATATTKRAPRPRIADDIREQIRNAYGTMSAEKAAKEFNVGRSSVERFWKDQVAASKQAKQKFLSGLDREGMVRMYRQGRTSTEIALMYNCSRKNVNHILNENGIVRRKSLTTKQAKNIERYYADGDTLSKISEKVGVSAGTVSSYISSHGLSNRNASRQNKDLLMAPLRLDGTPDVSKKIVVKYFDKENPNWTDDTLRNIMFLKAQQQYANDILHAQGYLFLSDVYKALGFDETEESRHLGWLQGDKVAFDGVPLEEKAIEAKVKFRPDVFELRFRVKEVKVPDTTKTEEAAPMVSNHPEFKISKIITIDGKCYQYILDGDDVRIEDPRVNMTGFAVGMMSRKTFIEEARELAAVADMLEKGKV